MYNINTGLKPNSCVLIIKFMIKVNSSEHLATFPGLSEFLSTTLVAFFESFYQFDRILYPFSSR